MTSTHYGLFIFIYYSADRRRMFYATPTTVTSGHGIILMLSSQFQRQRLGWNHQGHCRGLLSVTWQIDYSKISRFSRNCSTEAAWSWASSFETEVVVSSRRSCSALWGKHPAVTEREADCMASSVTGSVGTPKAAHLWSPTQDYGRSRDDLKQVWQRPMRTCLRRVRDNAMRGAAVCLEMDGGRLNIIVTMRRPWFNQFSACAIWRGRVSWTLNCTEHVAQYFRPFF
jgi:hypothetical protein